MNKQSLLIHDMMHFFRQTTRWSNREFLVIKICLVSLGICLGIVFHDALRSFLPLFLTVYFLTALAIAIMWMRKPTNRN